MAENNEPQDNLLSDAILDFLQKERDAITAEQQQQQQQPQVPEPVPEVVPTPEPEVPKQLQFFNKDLEIDLPENQSVPSILARLFRVRQNEFQLLRRNKIFKVHETEDKFVPALKVKGKYEVIKLQQRQRRISNGSQYQDCVEENDECTIILNNIQQKIPGGNVRKTQIAGLFNLQNSFRLIGQDGAILSHRNEFTLNPGATYHIIHSTQNVIKCPENEINQMPKEELSLNRPMSHTAPYFISVLRILFTLSFTEDVVIFSDEITQETKGSSLLCPSTLSTCAYQIAYGFNDLAKAIQNVVSKIAKKSYKKSYDCSATTQKYEVVPEAESEDEEEKLQHQLFEDSNNSESPLKDIAKIIELHQKSITELEDFVQIVMKQMRANSPTVNSVKISLQIKTEQEKQKLQRKKLAKIDHQELQKICKIIQKNDEQICPTSRDLYAVSSNRDQQNHAFEIVEKILQDFGDECVYADIAKLLSYCLQVSHCSLMHWMFAFELFKAMEYDEKAAAAGKVVVDNEQKQFAAIQIYRCLKIWDTVSLAVPFYVNLDDNLNENVNDTWKIMKDKIIAAQYALEICYNNQKRAA